MIFTSIIVSDGSIIGKTEHFKSLTENDHYSAIVDHVTATIHNIKLRSF